MKKTYFLLALIALSAACTTQKRRGDLSSLGKFYHNTTAKYNGYFNAKEIMKATLAQLEQQHRDNYSAILPLYTYLENPNPQGIYPQMDTAIKKVSVVVNLHRPSQWTDDCYLLLGQAQFLKKDYESAEATFKYMLKTFDPKAKKPDKNERQAQSARTAAERKAAAREANAARKETAKQKKKEQLRLKKEREKRMKARQKERARYNKAVKKAKKKGLPPPKRPSARNDNQPEPPAAKPAEDPKKSKKNKKDDDKPKPEEQKPENYFLKHRPVYQDAVLWMAKTLIERQKYDAAQRYITQLDQDPTTVEEVKRELPALQAYLWLRQNQTPSAILTLEQAVEATDKRSEKARYAFVLAQLQQQSGNSAAAYANFDRVLKYTNDYEMEFNARLNMAQNAWSSGRGSATDAIANLEKMLRDEKNTEHKDQIYFAMANIALKSGDRQAAIDNLTLSLENARTNDAQRAETSLLLAQLHFEAENFVSAKKYYDVALQSLPNTDKRYKEVENLSKNLTDIARYLETLTLQDSLLRISQMSEDEKKEFAAQVKKQREAERTAQESTSQNAAPQETARPVAVGLQKESSFFAYNERLLRQGKRDFQRKWGNRPLEDNWRRGSRQFVAAAETTTGGVASKPVAQVSEQEVEAILQGIPRTDAEITIANIRIREALFALGKLYRDRLQNNEKSIAALEELNRRYPGCNEELDSWYYLYLAYQELNRLAEANIYANKIVEKFPGSNYAKIIQDPNYIVQIQNEEVKAMRYYEDAYAAFTNGNYQYAYEQSHNAREKFGARHPLQPKFALLRAMSLGNLKGKEEYISALNEVVSKYPNSEEQKYAREVLRLLGSTTATLPGNQRMETDQFEIQDDQVHSVIVVLEDATTLNDSRNAVSDYNRKYHEPDNLRISDVFLVNGESRTPLIVIRRFRDKADAMRYVTGVQKNVRDFIPGRIKYEMYAITQTNYGKLFSTIKSVEAYRLFFEANYR